MLKMKALERVRYYPRQLMTAEDMSAEQHYFIERLRRHNRLFHGWGILSGLEVQTAASADKPWQVRVCPGDACAATGDEIRVPSPRLFDFSRPEAADSEDCVPCPCPPGPSFGAAPSGPVTVHLAIRYSERPTRPVRTGRAGCSCEEHDCEISRLREDYELALLDTLPVPYDPSSVAAENAWFARLKAAAASTTGPFGLPTRPWLNDAPSGWIILASVTGDLSKPPPAQATSTPDADLFAVLEGRWRRPLVRVEDFFGSR